MTDWLLAIAGIALLVFAIATFMQAMQRKHLRDAMREADEYMRQVHGVERDAHGRWKHMAGSDS